MKAKGAFIGNGKCGVMVYGVDDVGVIQVFQTA